MTILVDVDVLTDEKYHIIDVRTKEEYEHHHIPGALFLDFKKDLSGEKSFFPQPDKLGEKLGRIGIDEQAKIVIYDNGTQRRAAKAWVVLHYIGHETIHILQGGFPRWESKGDFEALSESNYHPVIYKVNVREDVALNLAQIESRLNDDDSILIDSRAKKRYTGELEPKYAKAGHIPGAKNYYAAHVFNEPGIWKDKQNLKSHFSDLNQKQEIVVSCGTGTSACLNLVALREAGFKDVKIYPGGFKEWIDHDYDIETGE